MVKVRRNKPKEKPEAKKKAKLSQFLDKKAEGRQNKYVFKGFYDKLTSISGKLSHKGSTGLDHLATDNLAQRLTGMGYNSEEEQDQESAFISTIYNTPRLSSFLSSLNVFSYNIVVAKKDQIVEKLIEEMQVDEEGQAKDPKMVVAILELLIALIKDLRKELDFESIFLNQIFPKVMSMINVFDHELLEQIMQFFSYTFKYMMPTILKNFDAFYRGYFPVLNHKNKFVKKFAAESFSYVLRKAKKEHVGKMINSVILKPLQKPYKFLRLDKTEVSGEVDMDIDGIKNIGKVEQDLKAHQTLLYARQNEFSDPAFCQFDKELESHVKATKFNRKIDEIEYEYEFSLEEKQSLLATLSTVFTEAVYGVQKGLFTEWKTFIDVLLDNISKQKDEQKRAWDVTMFRFTYVNLLNKLKDDSVNDLTQYIVEKFGLEFIKKNPDQKHVVKLETCLLLIRDMFIFREGKKVSSIGAISTIGFLYKLLKSQVKSEQKLSEKTLYLLTESIYVGLHNKTEQYVNIFSMDHTDRLVELVQNLGDQYLLHFYCLAGMDSIDQKFHDFCKYHIMLNNKQPMVLPNYYIRNEFNKHKLVFRPFLGVLEKLDLADDEKLISFLCQFIILWNKIGCPSVKPSEKLISRLDQEISKIAEKAAEDGEELISTLLNHLWLFSKVLSLSDEFSKCYKSLLKKLEKELNAYNSHQRYFLSQNHGIPDLNVNQILSFIPSLNNSYKLKLCVKANLLKVSQGSQGQKEDDNKYDIFKQNIEPNEQYFDSVLSAVKSCENKLDLFDKFPEYFGHPENGKSGKLQEFILTNRHSVRVKVISIYRELLTDHLEKQNYNFNPIELIFKMATTETSLENERVKENQLQKLMNIFRTQEMSLTMQNIYLRYLISLFWIKFTPLYKFVHSALGELLQNHHQTIFSEFLRIMDTFDYMLKVGPTDSILSKNLYPSLIPSYPRLRWYVATEVPDSADSLETRFSTTLSVVLNILKALDCLRDLPGDIQETFTSRFKSFMQNEFFPYHKEFSGAKNTDISDLSPSDAELVNNMISSNSVETGNYFQSYKRNSTKKLVGFLEIITKVDDMTTGILTTLLTANDVQVQSLALDHLVKKLPQMKKFEKSLKSFSSETEFKDEIVKFSLDKLDEQQKEFLLPYIIRILNAKLLKKRGKAGVKSIEIKRTIVYRFLASLDTSDLGIFIDQVIEPFGVTRKQALDMAILEQTLSQCSFGQYLAFMSALESIVKQMGSLIQDYLPVLWNIIIVIFKLSKKFYQAMKDAEAGEENFEEEPEEHEENNEDHEEVETGNNDPLKKNTLKSCKSVIAQTFKRINEIYEKYFYNKHIKEGFSEGVLEIYAENISNLHKQNITSKSALLETFETWSRHLNLHCLFLKSSVIEHLCKILSIPKDIVHFEVYTCIFAILKNIVLSSLNNSDQEEVDRRDAVIMSFLERQNEDNEENEEMTDVSNSDSVEIVKTKYAMVIQAISAFLGFNWEIIKNGVLNKKKDQKGPVLDKADKIMNRNTLTKSQVFRSPSFVKTIVMILSELSIYVNVDQKSDLEKLTDMFIPLLTVKGFLLTGKEDLVNYTLKTVERLCNKMPSLLTTKRYYLISKLLSENIKLSTRNHLCSLLSIIPDGKIKRAVNLVKNMNKIRKGLASATLDLDKAINACSEFQEKFLPKSKYPEAVPILFQMLHFVHNSELALRSAAVSLIESFLSKYGEDWHEVLSGKTTEESLCEDIKERSSFIMYHLLPSLRSNLNTNVDELILKSTFKLFKKYLLTIAPLHKENSEIVQKLQVPSELVDLACVITPPDDHTDFFENILNIKLQRRYRAIRQLCQKLTDGEICHLSTLTKFILPVADMFIIRMSQAQGMTRGVISYTKQNFEQINTE